MRKVVDGFIYDTNIAKLVGLTECWRQKVLDVSVKTRTELYLTPKGHYFEVEILFPDFDKWWNRWLNPLPFHAYYRPRLTPLSPRIARSLAEHHEFDLEKCKFEPELA